MKKVLTLFIVLNCVGSCVLRTKKTQRIVAYYDNGQILSKKIFSADSDTLHFVLEEYYENGNMLRTGPVNDSIIYGHWEYFYENGNLEQKGNYVMDDSLNEGEWTYSYQLPLIDEKGDTLEERKWMCGLEYWARENKNLHVCKDGFWEFYHENGIVKKRGTYKMGWYNGKWEEYAENGQLILASDYNNGTAIGEWKYWYPNGQLMKFVRYTDSSKLLMEAYTQNGIPQVIDGKGEFKEATSQNPLDSFFATYDNGILNGPYITFFENGKIETKGQYKNGKKEGKWMHYYFYYGLNYTRNYRNGNAHGHFYHFYIDGDTTQIRFFVDDLEHGVTEHRDEHTGKTTLLEPWEMGKRHGIRKYFNAKGVPELYQFFYDGEMVGDERFELGKLIKRRIFEGDESKFAELQEK